MAAETRLLICKTQAVALQVRDAINANLGIGTNANTTTITYAYPSAIPGDPDNLWSLPFPTDDRALTGIDPASYFVSAGLQAIPATSVITTVSAPITLRNLFTSAEVEAITIAATKEMVVSNYTSGKLQVLMDTLDASTAIGLNTARVQGGFAYLVSAGLLTADRAGLILAPVGVLPQSSWVAE
jgi:hypothetical protein